MKSTATLRFASGLLKALIVLNLVFLLLFLVIGVGSFFAEQQVVAALVRGGADDPVSELSALRLVMLIAAITVLPAHLILTRLLRMVTSVGAGEAFAVENARRLKTIAWALLAIQFLDLAFGWVSFRFEDVPSWSPSLTGWIAVLLLFVLAHVFEQGAAMREELDATV